MYGFRIFCLIFWIAKGQKWTWQFVDVMNSAVQRYVHRPVISQAKARNISRMQSRRKRGYRGVKSQRIWVIIQKALYYYCPPIICWNGGLQGHFLGIKMQHWNKWLSSLYMILLVFGTLSTPSKKDAWKKLQLPKVGKR